MNQILAITFLVLVLPLGNVNVNAHCEIPCGIYEDTLRIELIKEHITTIEKSIKQINEVSKSQEINYNQLVRWVDNKEKHAEEIQQIVSQYFLHQRIKIKDPEDKEAYKNYQEYLVLLHHIQVYAMKCKQSTSLDNIAKIRAATKKFEDKYFHSH